MSSLDQSGLTGRRMLLGWFAGGLAVAVGACSRSGGSGPRPEATKSTTTTVTPTPGPTPSSSPADPLPEGVVNVLVLGSDSRSQTSFDGRADVITLVQLNPERTRVNLVSIPRDVTQAGRGKVGETYARAGAEGMRERVSAILGDLPIQYTVETTFNRFVRIMELLGGVTVQNLHASHSFGPTFPAGPIEINGEDALAYVRERKGLPHGDLDRTERHRATLTAIVEKVHALAAQAPKHLAELVPQLYDQVRIGALTTEQAQELLRLAPRLTASSVTSVMLPIARFGKGGSTDVVNAARSAELAAALQTADLTGYVAAYGTGTGLTG